MAKYCSNCSKKIGFFEKDFDGMCKSCYDKFLEEKQLKLQRENEEKKRKLEEKKAKEMEQKKLLEEKKKKDSIEKLNYIKSIMLKNRRFTVVSANILYRIVNLIDSFRYNIDISIKNIEFDRILYYVINKLPLNPTYKDVENINTYKYLKEFILECNSMFNINTQILMKFKTENENSKIRDFESYKEMLFINTGTLESSYKFTLNLLDNSIKQCEMTGGEIMIQYAKECQEDKRIESISYLYQHIIALLYGLLFYNPIIDIIVNDKELYTIFNNLINSKADKDYISKKLFEMYDNIYKNKFSEQLTQKDFDIITIILISNVCFKQENICNYYEIDENKKLNIKFEEIPANADEILYKNIVMDFLKNYSNDLDFSKFIKILSSFEVTAITFYNMGISKKNELVAQKERERLLNGDMSKEIEMQKQAVEYSNVQNGYEFEEYVANLYKKLGYTIEEVTKKSGDQGADVIAYKNNIKYVIQVKFYNTPVGNKAVQEVAGAIGMYNANKGIVVTNNTFTQSAIELANANNIELVDGEKIEEYKKIIIDNI